MTGAKSWGKFTRDELTEAERIARDCRREMRGFAMWWRRGSLGSTPEIVLRGAIKLRFAAQAMDEQAARIRQRRKESAVC
jgi:hypothetical protein